MDTREQGDERHEAGTRRVDCDDKQILVYMNQIYHTFLNMYVSFDFLNQSYIKRRTEKEICLCYTRNTYLFIFLYTQPTDFISCFCILACPS